MSLASSYSPSVNAYRTAVLPPAQGLPFFKLFFKLLSLFFLKGGWVGFDCVEGLQSSVPIHRETAAGLERIPDRVPRPLNRQFSRVEVW